MMYPRNLPLLIISILILANVLALVRGQSQTYCSNSNNTVITAYQSNLLYLLGSMPSNMDRGFYNASRGQDTDRVNIMAICRADTQPDICSGCVSNLTDDISASCLIERQAIIWSFLCWLHYSDTPTFGIIDYHNMFWEWDPRNVTGAPDFMSNLMVLLNGLIPRAARGGSLQKVAFGNRSTSHFQTIYALVQCTPDLSEQDCVSCLTTGVQQLSRCCEAKGNVRVNVANCDIRYGTAHFYNETRLLELDSPTVTVSRPSAPPLLLGGKKDSATTQTIIIIVVVSAFTGEAQSLPSPPPATAGYADLLRLKFDEIRVATNDFSKELGRGAFGAVFWGKLPGGREIAVKRLEIGSNQGEREFKAEVSILAQLKHRNLVTLIGFSSEGEEKLLVYEYVENGCLSKFLFDRTECPNLDWKTRYNIIEGIVKGIVYLHEDSQLKIVHRDLKPSNILLDGNMDSKIADFGLARLIELDETHCSTNKVAGTPGYIAPEYQFLHQISMKSDVFSFGVLLLEIISGQKNSRHGHLTSRAWDAWETRTVENLVDPVLLKDASSMLGTILRCIHIGLLCVQPKANDRPSIASIAAMLNSPSMLLPEPSNTGFYTEFHSVESQ